MTKANYKKLKEYLDIIEAELNKIAASLGLPTVNEYFKSDRRNAIEGLCNGKYVIDWDRREKMKKRGEVER